MWGIIVIVLLICIWGAAKRNNKIYDVRMIQSKADEKMKKEIRAYRKMLNRQYDLYERILNYEITYDQLRAEVLSLEQDIDALMENAKDIGR